jgi:hypothetical protein
MARLLSDEASQYLDYAGATVTAYPFTISGWLYPDEAKFHTILSVCTTTEDQDFVWLGTTATVGRVRVDNATVQGTASTVDTWNINAWNHLVGVFTNSTSRSVLLNGGTKGTNATDVAMPGGLNNTALGRLNQSQPVFGYLRNVRTVSGGRAVERGVDGRRTGDTSRGLFAFAGTS